MNPTINDFPDQKVLAASVLSSVASKAEQLDLAPIDRLALLSQEADAAGLDLPFVTVAILAWRNQIRELLALYAQTKDTPAVAKPLLLQTRALVRSERFDYATTLEMATVSLVWGLLERQCGSESKAVAAWEWAVEQYEHAPEDERSDAADVARALGFAIGGPQGLSHSVPPIRNTQISHRCSSCRVPGRQDDLGPAPRRDDLVLARVALARRAQAA